MGRRRRHWRGKNGVFSLFLALATWNCLGLGKSDEERDAKIDYCRSLGYDILCLTELWNHQRTKSDFLVSAVDKKDRPAGVGLLFSERLRPYVTSTGACGSRIVWARIKGPTCNLVVVGVYLPHSKRKSAPHAHEVLKQLSALMGSFGSHECVIILGDLNAQLPRNKTGLTGRWTLSKKGDSGNAPEVMRFMGEFGMAAVNTFFQPKRNATVATWHRPSLDAIALGNQAGYQKRSRAWRSAPKQLDYILCRRRWRSCVTSSEVDWTPVIMTHGAKWDHALVSAIFRWRVRSLRPTIRRDLRALRFADSDESKLLKKATAEFNESSGFWQVNNASDRYRRMVDCWQGVKKVIPLKPQGTRRKSFLSQRTLALMAKRAKILCSGQRVTPKWRHNLHRLVSRSMRRDKRDHVKDLTQQVSVAESRNDPSEAARLVRIITQRPRHYFWDRQPTVDVHGKCLHSDRQLADAWREYRAVQFTTRLNASPMPDLGTIHPWAFPEREWNMVRDRIKLGKAVGWDGIPSGLFKYSGTWFAMAKRVAQDVWDEQEVPDDMVVALMRNIMKKGRAQEKWKSYRPVCVLVACFKLITTMLYLRVLGVVKPKLEKWNAGFQTRRGYVDNTVVLNYMLRRCAQAGERLLVVMTDIDSAFDSIDHSTIFSSLIDMGVDKHTISVIMDIYRKAKAVIKVGGTISKPFNIGRGTFEGDIMSPLLFLTGLQSAFKEAGPDPKAPTLAGIQISQLGFADDVNLLTTGDTSDAQARLVVVSQCLHRRGLRLSTKRGKCALMHGGRQPTVRQPTAADIEALKLKYACDYCGERRFVNMAGKRQHERTCDLGRDILHPGRYDVDEILDVRGSPGMRFYHVKWAPGQLGEDVTWEPERNLGNHCAGVIREWFLNHPEWHQQDAVEVDGEFRCERCNKRDFASAASLKAHCTRVHQRPAVAGTLAYKHARKRLKEEAHESLPKISVGDTTCDNVWSRKWLGSWTQADGEQDELVSNQLNMLRFYYSGMRGLLCDDSMLLQWRVQWYVSGVVAPALHNVGAWLLDGRTMRRMNGANSRLLSRITGRSVHQEARAPTFDIVQWAKWKRARWLGHILREPELSLVRESVFEEAEGGRSGTLLDDAPPHRSRQHLQALASKQDNTWEEWCKELKSAVRPKKEGLRRNRGGQRDPTVPSIVVPPPVCLRGSMALSTEADATGRGESVADIVARAMAELGHGRPLVDATAPTDLYTDGSCLDPGKPWAAAGWGVHVVNSDKLGDYYGALPGSIQTNSRAELVALEASLQLA